MPFENQARRYGQKVETATAHPYQVFINPRGYYKGKFYFGTQDCKRQPAFFGCKICERLHG